VRKEKGERREKVVAGSSLGLFCRLSSEGAKRAQPVERDVEKERVMQSAHSDIFSGSRSSPFATGASCVAVGQSQARRGDWCGATSTVQEVHDNVDVGLQIWTSVFRV
jgi:hypothetical protein